MSTNTLPSFTTYLYSLQECAVPADWECAICSTPAPETDEPEDIADVPEVGDYPVQTTCGHIFDLRCLYKWMVSPQDNNGRCPMCRTQLYGWIHAYCIQDGEHEVDPDHFAQSDSEDSDTDDDEMGDDDRCDDDLRLEAVKEALKQLEGALALNSGWEHEPPFQWALARIEAELCPPGYESEYEAGEWLLQTFSRDWPHIIKDIMDQLHENKQYVPSWMEQLDQASDWIEASLAVMVVQYLLADEDWVYIPQMVELQEYLIEVRDMHMTMYGDW